MCHVPNLYFSVCNILKSRGERHKEEFLVAFGSNFACFVNILKPNKLCIYF